MKKLVVSLFASVALVGIVAGCGGDNLTLKAIPELPTSDFSNYEFEAAKQVKSSKGVVTSTNAMASKVGIEVLAAGGNAFEAAMATSLAVSVTNPWFSGLGGGGYLVGYDAAKKQMISYDFREVAPKTAVDSTFTSGAKYDAKAAGLPGYADGFFKVIEEHGDKFTAKDLIEPSRILAEKGFTMDGDHASNFQSAYTLMGDTMSKKDADAMYLKDDGSGKKVMKGVGDNFANPVLAKTFRKMQEQGRDAIYKGEIAKAMVEGSKFKAKDKDTGVISYYDAPIFNLEELAGMIGNTKAKDPVSATYRGKYTIASMPPSSSAGITIVETMNMLETLTANANDSLSTKFTNRNDPNLLHAIGTALQLSYGDRYQFIADENQVFVPKAGLVNKDYAKKRFNALYEPATADKIKVAKVMGSEAEGQWGNPCEFDTTCPSKTAVRTGGVGEGGGTTSLSVADTQGNVVTITQTVNGYFGNGVFVGGFPLNNEMNDFAGKPSAMTEADYKKLSGAVAPGKRPLSSMAPTIVLEKVGTEMRPVFTAGASGGTSIIPSVVNNLVNVLDYGMSAGEASEYAKVHSMVAATPTTTYYKLDQTNGVTDVLKKTLNASDWGKLTTEQKALYELRKTLSVERKTTLSDYEYFGNYLFRGQITADLVELYPGSKKQTPAAWLEEMGYYAAPSGGIGVLQSIKYTYDKDNKATVEGSSSYSYGSTRPLGWN